MTYLHIKNWEEWQSYRKDRGTPPWIKVHRKLLTSPKWAVLSDAEKGQLISIWIVAADNGGKIPDSSVVIRKICQLDEEPNLKKFKDLGLMTSSGCQDDVKVASRCQPLDAPETETEAYSKEAEVEIELTLKKEFTQFWEWFPVVNRTKGSKKKAEASFRRALKKDDFNQLIQGVDMYGKFIKHNGQSNADAFRWLDDERWKDDWVVQLQPATNTSVGISPERAKMLNALGIG